MRLGSVGRLEEGYRSDLESHADVCVCGKEILVFNDFDLEVTATVNTQGTAGSNLTHLPPGR
jgi:hypothetical protein